MKQPVLIYKGQATPFNDGDRIQLVTNKFPGTIIRQCPCTSKLLHYEVLLDGSKNGYIAVNHIDIEKI